MKIFLGTINFQNKKKIKIKIKRFIFKKKKKKKIVFILFVSHQFISRGINSDRKMSQIFEI